MAHRKNSKPRKLKGRTLNDETDTPKINKQKASSQKYNANSNASTKWTLTGIMSSLAVVGLAYFWRVYSNRVEQLSTPLGRLMYHWPPGEAVTIQGTGSYRRVVATQRIQKGGVALSAEEVDLEGELLNENPELKSLVDQMLPQVIQEQSATLTTLTSSTKILVMIRLLELIDIQKNERWTAYADTLPENVTTVSWYWTPEERNCTVPRPTEDWNLQDLRVFHAVMARLSEASPLVQQIYSPQNATKRSRAEWALLMMKTRAFGNLYFLPIMDMINHNALQAISPFSSNHREYLVAARDIEPGEQVYNNYGELSPMHCLEMYGFVPSEAEAAYFEVPSIQEDLWHSPWTKAHPECTKDQGARFFGNVGHYETVEAEFERLKKATTFKAYMPTRTAPACMRAMLQSQTNDTDLARYVASKLQYDHDRYDAMAQAPHCQSNDANFPLIRQANQVTAWLLKNAHQVADAAANDASIPYPRKAK